MSFITEQASARTSDGFTWRDRTISRGLACCNFLILLLLAVPGQAVATCTPAVGTLVSVEGRIEVQRDKSPDWLAAGLNETLCQGDTVRAAERSRATVQLTNQSVLRIDQNSAMSLDKITPNVEERSFLSLLKGAIQSFSRRPRGFEVSTPYLNGSIEGTEFVFRVTNDESILTVFEGMVLASNAQGSASVSGGNAVAAKAGQPPRPRTLVRPRDAAQWSLYYPPILATGGTAAAGIAPALREAATELSVGRVDAARSRVEQAISQDSAAGLAYALRAVINVVLNQREQALADGHQAVALSPDSAAAKIAHSYALQASFRLPEARDILLQAVEQQPADALARARLAELQLMLGHREEAGASARQAVTLAPELARTRITLGFVALAEFRITDATAAFEKAIELDSADPLPHLGLGLARIKNGELESGRREIEVAVGLDSNNALLRAYLGKAYFEEKRAPLDSDQFDIARQLDPNDPTAYLYSGIAKQTANQPVEALRDLEASVERNDNRAAYRGRLLLDQDRAARGTSLARVHKDLGFAQLGVSESTRSLTLDPSDASGHRFLSDSYRDVRRREISRVSEQLQAQLMQDININPVQPSVSETNLNVVTSGGPGGAGFNEFTPLFETNGMRLDATGFAGNNDTAGGEAVVSALFDRFSLSAGVFSYDSDGWRDNNDLDQDIYNIFAQWAVTSKLNVQAEYRRRESTEGDLAFDFDPDAFSDKMVDRDQDTARFGLRYSPAPDSDFLFSYINANRDERLDETEIIDPFLTAFVDVTDNSDGDQYEGQYIHRSERYNLVTGAAYSDVDRKIHDFIVGEDTFFGLPPIVFILADEITRSNIEHPRGYVYVNIHSMESLTWTLGASYDDYDDGLIDETNFNPKLGVQYDVSDKLSLRAAALKTVKPALVNNRTLEPTQIAGFNQFFDDINATETVLYGAGLDRRLGSDLTVGVELTWRDLEEPVNTFDAFFNPDVVYEDRDEEYHRIYAYWTPMDRVGVSAEVIYDHYESEKGIATAGDNLPEDVKTVSLPVVVRYFSPSGFFAGIGGTYVDQDVDRSLTATEADGHDNFFLVDASAGYRLPGRRGIISLAVKNLFDEEINYQDDSYREFRDEPATGPYFPELTILGQVTLSF